MVQFLLYAFVDSSKIGSSVMAVMIIACPCALQLSNTFTNGNIFRALASFIISIIYNIISIYYTAQGNLSPMIAATLMPLSSLNILLITFGSEIVRL